ncbi:histidine phosphatase family protein [Lysinibacillus sp. KU-BSD001]|uniref:histidine phosphatase family protein n=1 Tax=Lysinibacillus sp. KU-BSD001 TaxID=3141328 RepID=UPI0036E3F5FD
MEKSLLNLLREGGWILYVRHGEATVGEDQPYIHFQNCYTQRNLSELGRRQAIYYGDMIRYLRIPIRLPIQASPFCRTIETAQLAFGCVPVQIHPFWFEVYQLDKNSLRKEQTFNTLRSILEMKPPKGTNQVIIAHGFPDNIGLGQISNMGTVIVRPLGIGKGYEVLKKLSLEDLAALVSSP